MIFVVRAFNGALRIPYRDASRHFTDVVAAKDNADLAFTVLAVTTFPDMLTVGVWVADVEPTEGEWDVSSPTVASAIYMRGKPANLILE